MRPEDCPHVFMRRRGWWWRPMDWDGWRCIRCRMTTRTYDPPDRMAGRPLHPRMSVAHPGYNTVKGRTD